MQHSAARSSTEQRDTFQTRGERDRFQTRKGKGHVSRNPIPKSTSNSTSKIHFPNRLPKSTSKIYCINLVRHESSTEPSTVQQHRAAQSSTERRDMYHTRSGRGTFHTRQRQGHVCKVPRRFRCPSKTCPKAQRLIYQTTC